ncbi:C4-dicarboxylate TRAP transporter substrate-binding protein [Sedimentitalea nanhaiensis]|uniref:TRAP-type C4-dicarboxylate transport system, substrate-binding protein n=1 Tax=Sedimentitalea nanhaiensis TaxID=999627 RepID=A0A1I7BFK1_9RHOB|nr:C4-dicarboxylate TRAP transporter substrate-binding protein [Sedimentitalea nanhaiensis]SFT85938.1 TRAP-type C4-dicarboxylate transport system, substrate-binding protein [Sedimentitalea nanhaiensis]
MTTTRRAFLATTSAALAVPFLNTRSIAADTISIQIGSSHPTNNIWVYAMQNALQPALDKLLADAGGDYTVSWNENYGGTLYKFKDTRAAVRDGIVDVGMVGTVWEGSAMPLQNVTYFTPFANADHTVTIDIFDKLTEELPELRAGWTDQNMVHLSSLVTDSYDVYATFPISSVDDIANRRLNAPGTSANWLAGTGCSPVDGALTTYYTDIQTGVSEGTLSFASGIQPTRVYEVAPHLSRVGFGSMYFGGIAVNKRFFDRAPAPVQAALKEAGRITSRAHGAYITKRATEAMTEMKAAGLQVTEMASAERERWAATLPNVAKPWLDANGAPATAVLKAYFAELQARGIAPARDWTAGL